MTRVLGPFGVDASVGNHAWPVRPDGSRDFHNPDPHASGLDGLTGALRHDVLRRRLDERLASPDDRKMAVVVLNIDNFRLVNDGYGHAVGDGVLTEVTNRLRMTVRDGDLVGRIGGDEFIMLLNQVNSPIIATEVCERLKACLRNQFRRGAEAFRLTASIGIAVTGRHGDAAESLIRNATSAMMRVKRRGGDGIAVAQQNEASSPAERLRLEQDLRDAMDRQEFELYFQPKFAADARTVLGAEALLRWHHPERGMVPPNDFIPIAEDTGLIVSIGDWVLREALCTRRRWSRDPGLRRVPTVSVNISFRQFESPGFFEVVQDAISRSGCEPHALELELTETVLMLNAVSAIDSMRRLRALGVGLSIDDFGTGYSSLNLLKRIPLSTLKIDRSFVKDLPHSREDAAITRSIASLAHTLGFDTVAEGVETQEQLDFLRSIGCGQVQGFLLGPPLPEEQFLSLVKVFERSQSGVRLGSSVGAASCC